MVGVAFAGAFDHDGDGDLWILHWSEADEPGEVHFLTVSAEVGGASFTGNAEVVDLHQPTGAVGADDSLHTFPEQARLFGRQTDRFAAMLDLHGVFAREGFEGWLGARLAACDGGNGGGHLQWGLQEKALTDGGVGGVARHPAADAFFLFPGFGRHDETAGFKRDFDASSLIEAEAFGFGAEQIDAHLQAFGVIKYIAAAFNGRGQISFAMTVARVAAEHAVADSVHSLAIVRGVGVDDAVAHTGDRGDELKGGAGRVGELHRAVEPCAALVDGFEGLARDEGAQVVEIVGRMAD